MVRTSIALLALVILPASAGSQEIQHSNPTASASCKFDDGKAIHTVYSSLSMKGRPIFGELVPFGQVWRTGANQATTFVTEADLSAGGKEIPAGHYTLFTLP